MVELADTHALGACGGILRGGSSPLFGIYIKYIKMIKKIIRPFQKVLIEKRLCVACTHPLERCKKIGDLSDNRKMIECKCKRRYVYDKELDEYQRATFAEEQQILKEIQKRERE